jgi:hypothetical protein
MHAAFLKVCQPQQFASMEDNTNSNYVTENDNRIELDIVELD